jgi:hypothetical protein
MGLPHACPSSTLLPTFYICLANKPFPRGQNVLVTILDQASGSVGYKQKQIRMLEELLVASGASTPFKTPPQLSAYGTPAHISALGLNFITCQMELIRMK